MPQTITVDDFTITAELPEDRDELPPVLFVHGLFASAWCFETMLRRFADRGFPAYAVTLSGRPGGRPVDQVGQLTVADFSGDVRDAFAWVAANHSRKPALIGHSMGGLLAQMTAARLETSALVLMSSAPPRGIALWNPRLAIRQVKYLPQLIRREAVLGTLNEHAAVSLNRLPADQRAAAYEKLVPDSGRAALEISLGMIPVDENAIRCPVICITGTDDRFVPPGVTRRVAARYHAPVWEYEGHGHFLPIEPGHEKITDDVATWLRHVALMQEHPARSEDLWKSFQEYVGDVADISYFDGRTVRAEIVNVDLAVRRNVVFRVIEQLRPGSVPAAPLEEGDMVRASLNELSAVVPPVID
jgi:pimeloyl-ACP methyl ester carboxylesterase